MHEPGFVRSAFVEVVGVAFNDGSGSTQCFDYR
jgi:hypothetical protein